MMRKIILAILFLGFSSQLVTAQDDLDITTLNYIKKFSGLAMQEQIRSGIPAAITLAQGIHESASGQSRLAKEGQNHFGIKCKSTWKGPTILHDDDARQECFRKYAAAEDSYKDHSDFLKAGARYNFLFNLELTDYSGWSKGLKKAGYATNPQYPIRLIELIEKYNLQQFTYLAMEPKKEQGQTNIVQVKDEITPPKNESKQVEIGQEHRYYKVTSNKGLSGFWAKKGDYLLNQAMENNIRLAKLLEMNDLPNEELPEDMFIYLQRKNKKGARKYHIIEEGETLLSISQKEAVQLKSLKAYNAYYLDHELVAGEKIYMQDFAPDYNENGTSKPDYLITKDGQDNGLTPKSEKTKNVSKKENKREGNTMIITKKEEVIKIESPAEPQQETPLVKLQEPIQEAPTIIEENVVEPEAELPKVEKVVSSPPMKIEENKIEVAVEVNPNIIDVQKAKKIEAMLNDGKSEIYEVKAVPTKEIEPQKQAEEAIMTVEPIQDIKEEKKPERTYNEKNVNDDVKDLKKKFDSIIYKK